MNPLMGTIQAFGFSFAPKGWLSCDGQLLAISSNTALFSLLGTTYGGNGTTTFGIPDLRGRLMLHQGQGPGLTNRVIGEMSGSETTTLTVASMPSHTHPFGGSMTGTPLVNKSAGAQDSPVGAVPAVASNDNYTDSSNFPGLPNSVTVDTSQLVVSNNGAGTPYNNMEPFLVINWCIAQYGIFPSRS
ncbi:MAG: tail fiber protein [Bacteroidia bacterium]|nr:tail fiber protein [Bacteroidia bacterium]